jgi:hypothetical protein
MAVRGVRAAEIIAGKRGRYLLSTFVSYLRAKPGAKNICFECCAAALHGVKPQVFVNDDAVDLELGESMWQHIRLALPAEVAVVELRIDQPELVTVDRTWMAELRDVGLAVSRLWTE